MFLNKTRERNPAILDAALALHASGQIRPDTWVIDLDTLLANAGLILGEAKKYDITLYYMTKQLGRNPLIASRLQGLGYRGAVAVDYKEASVLLNAGLRLGHVGHLVQIPTAEISKIVRAHPEIVTVYSVEKAEEIAKNTLEVGREQPIMLRMWDEESPRYPGQEAGFALTELKETLRKLSAIKGIRVAGLTAFPCFLYDENKKDIVSTVNVELLSRSFECVKECLPSTSGFQINMPSATCVRTLSDIAALGGTHAEPGHGLSGTTPLHVSTDQPEAPAMIYLTEISHHRGHSSMAYGGGFYRRGHLQHAIIDGKMTTVVSPDVNAIDYHFELQGHFPVGSPVLMASRAQMFVTRSDVAVVEGIHKGTPRLLGIYDPLGYPLKEKSS